MRKIIPIICAILFHDLFAGPLADAMPNPTVVGQGAFCLMYNGSTWDRCPGTVALGLKVNLTAGDAVVGRVKVSDGTDVANVTAGGRLEVTCDNCGGGATVAVEGEVAHDASGASTNPALIGGYASAAAPANVSTDGDAVRAWHLLSGAYVTQLSYAGTLASTGNGVVGGGVQRVAIASDNTAFGVNLAQYTPASGRLPVDGSGVTQPVSGTVTANLAAGTNNIGDVDVLTLPSVTVGTFPDNEPFNVAQINGVTPLMGNGVTGTGSQRVTIASDNTAFSVNATLAVGDNVAGRLKISDGTDLALVSGSGALNVTCDNCGGSSFADQAAFTWGTTPVSVAGYLVDETAPDPATENSAATPRMSTNRVAYSQLRDAAGNERGANVTASNALVVDGSAVTQPVSGTVTINAIPAGSANIGDVDVLTLPSVTVGTFPDNEPFNVAQINGVTPLMGNGVTGTGSQRVTIASDNTAFSVNVGTFPDNEPVNVAQYGGTTVVNGGTAGLVGVGGPAAADAAVSGNPVLRGGRASTAVPTAMSADGDAVHQWMDRYGSIVVRRINDMVPFSCGLSAIGTTLTQCQAAPAAGLSLYITGVVAISNTTTAGKHTLRFGTGTNCATGTGNIFFASASALIASLASTAAPANYHFYTPIKVTAANAVCVLGVVTNTTNISITGYTAP